MPIKVTKNKALLKFERPDGKTATYNLATTECKNFQGRTVKSLQSFFANYSTYNLEWEDDAYRRFVDTVRSSNRRLRNIGSMLLLLHEYRHTESWLLLGFPVDSRMSRPVSDYPKTVRKYLLKRFGPDAPRDRYRYNHGYNFHRWLNFLSDEGTEKIRFVELLQSLELPDELGRLDINDVRTLYNMSRDYNMDMKSLLLQIGYYMMREGLSCYETIRNLNDYNRMSKAMSPRKWQKYPKYLLSTHHIVVRNYNAFRETYEEQAFQNMVNDNLAHKGVTYSVLTAKSSQDIKDEGAQQHHCVASYVKQVIEGQTQIVFMRNNKELDKPLLTIEVKDGKVYQAKGSYNRQPTVEEMKFIKTYANQKNLGIGAYL